MDRDQLDRLKALPPLASKNRQFIPCKICGDRAFVFDVVDFNKCCAEPECYPYGMCGVPVVFFRCTVCRFLFTNFFDDWTQEDFARFVYNDDYINVDGEYAGPRPDREAEAIARTLAGHNDLKILDYGSGSGLFADRLRSRGFQHVVAYDPFARPDHPGGSYDVITCFEVLEHSTSPHATLSDIARLLKPDGLVIFSTGIQPSSINEVRGNWWYVAPRNGHASIFTFDALARLGQSHGFSLHIGSGNHAFVRPDSSAKTLAIQSGLGRSLRIFELAAPDSGPMPAGQSQMWHDVESNGAATYRWTRESEIEWRLQSAFLRDCELSITVPIVMEVQPGFADNCILRIGRQKVRLARDSDRLIGSISIDQPTEAIVKLVTPLPLRPNDLRPVADNRPLGLAIAVRNKGSGT